MQIEGATEDDAEDDRSESQRNELGVDSCHRYADDEQDHEEDEREDE